LKKTRSTRQRTVILEILRQSGSHPTAEAIYLEARKALPHISLGTVYRNLNFLRDHGLVREIRSNNEASSRFEGHCPPHAHFHCTCCRTVRDIPLPDCITTFDWQGAGCVSRVSSLELHVIGACSQCSLPVS
jgi:Fe2+ or Zn2+ uptake regulation protein